jgi:hypothetical protein
MGEYKLFEFTPEIVDRIKTQRTIPVNFYNNKGQILIQKMEKASEDRIEKLFHFMAQGIYYAEEDREKLGIKEKPKLDTSLQGLTETRLLENEQVHEMTSRTSELFDTLRASSLSSAYTRTSQKMMTNIFADFNGQDDAMVGIINILDLMKDQNAEFDVLKATKRIVTAMALKTRGMRLYQNTSSEKDVKRQVTDLMMSALFCDIGYLKMKHPSGKALNKNEMEYMKNHPILSYLMIIHDPIMTPHVKHSVLTHHRPIHGSEFVNNYPSDAAVFNKLSQLTKKFNGDLSKKVILNDIREQVELFKKEEIYNEDSNILAISSEFASLTSRTEWREAFDARHAIQMILNNSFFTYPYRIIREFLDYVSISLAENKKIMNEGDFLVIACPTSKGGYYYDLCRVESVGRYQSKPGIRRLGTVEPAIVQDPKLMIKGLDLTTYRKDPRQAYYDLQNDETKRIVYMINREFNEKLYDEILNA